MKKFTLFSLLFFVTCASIAQIPQFINYQAVARYNNSNIPIPHQPVTVNFKLIQGNPGGPIIFEETQTTTTDDCGLFNIRIGNVNRNSFSTIDWSTGNKFLKVTINDKVSGITELLSVPYSLHADKALKATKADYATLAKSSEDWRNVGDTILYSIGKNIGIGTLSPSAPLDLSSYMRIKSNGSTSTRIRFDAATSADDHWITSFDDNGNRIWVLNFADRSIGNRFGLFSDKTQTYVFNVTTDGNVGIKTNASPSYALSVAGEINVNGSGSVNCLTIKGGCDWYEESNTTDDLQPGEIAVINVDGSLNSVLKSSKAYDRTVVGVVSGAGGINPGIGLKQSGILEGNTKIAMGGKVKVYVFGDVKPGDLLTSSAKPGYAMAVKNRKKAFGAVIGKALTEADKDGLVLMQVMTQ